MTTIYDIIKTKLTDFPDFRERRFREKYLVKLALRSCGLENKEETKNALTIQELADFAHTYTSYDRLWRKCLNENEHLRGKDYTPDKDRLEQETMLSLGYEGNHFQDIKKLQTL